jgi:hypothetical protein
VGCRGVRICDGPLRHECRGGGGDESGDIDVRESLPSSQPVAVPVAEVGIGRGNERRVNIRTGGISEEEVR